MTLLAEVGYYEPWWIQLLKGLVIFAVVFQLVPVVLLVERITPGGGAAWLASLEDDFVDAISAAGDDIVIVYGERLLGGPHREVAAKALLNLAARLGLAGREGAGLLEIPASTNGRGLREVGFAPGHGPGYAPLDQPGGGAAEIAGGLAAGELNTLYLLHADPLRTHPDRALWEAGLANAQTVIAHESVLTETVRRHATVVFPAEAYAEKEGTLVHPDGRLQRLRAAIGRAKGATPGGGVRAGWQVVTDVAARAGHPLEVASGPLAWRRLFEAVPFYAGITLDEIGGRGVRWPAHESAARFEVAPWKPVALELPKAAEDGDGLRLGTYRSLWSSKEVDVSPALKFMRPQQVVELSPDDAGRLGLGEGDRVEVGSDGTRVRGPVRLRQAVPSGSVFLAEGTTDEPANALTEALVEIRRIGGPATEASGVPAQVQPAADRAEARPSAPLEIPPTGAGQTGHGA
jgi:NADH-quinone oxidoreductase subunit G